MKPKKIDYYDGKNMTYQYEYRCFKYTPEVKKNLKIWYGLNIRHCIDNFLDRSIDKIIFESRYKIYTVNFYRGELNHSINISEKTKNFDGTRGIGC